MMGPKGADSMWQEPMQKWENVTGMIAQANLTAYMAVQAYNSRAFSKLSYLLQILPYPTKALQLQRRFIHMILKTPLSALRDKDFYSLH
eukprot:11556131-Karenia_brevis.AAC.1